MAALIASFFWLPSALGFLAAALALWGWVVPGVAWRQRALASAVLSTLGSALFNGVWPGAPNRQYSNLDTAISLVINVAIIVALQVLNWPAQAMLWEVSASFGEVYVSQVRL